MRIIRISGCHDCDKRGIAVGNNGGKALFPKYWCPKLNTNIMIHFKNKTLPSNCPLEEVEWSGEVLHNCEYLFIDTDKKAGSVK